MMPSDDEMLSQLSALAMDNAEQAIEIAFRRIYPQVTHDRYLELTSSAAFWRMYRTQFLARRGIAIFRLVMEAQLKKAEKGDLKASEFLFQQLGLVDGFSHKDQPKITVELFLNKMAEAIGEGLRPRTLPETSPAAIGMVSDGGAWQEPSP